MENTIYESQECKDLVKKVVDFDANLIEVSTHLKENYNVDLELDENGDITLQAAEGTINESQSLMDAKAYVLENLDESYFNEVLFI